MNAALRSFWALAATLLLGGCASLTPDGGFAPVEQAAQTHLGKALRWARSAADQEAIDQRVVALLAEPLSADASSVIERRRSRNSEWYSSPLTKTPTTPSPSVICTRSATPSLPTSCESRSTTRS